MSSTGRDTPPQARSAEAVRPATSATGGIAAVSPTQLVSAIERSAAYFEGKPVHGDQAHLLIVAAALLSKEFQTWAAGLAPLEIVLEDAQYDPEAFNGQRGVEGRLWAERSIPRRPWAPLAKPADLPPLHSAIWLTDQSLRDLYVLMNRIFACRGRGADAQRDLVEALSRPGRGYVLSHQLVGAGWARDRGCLPDTKADALRASLAPLVYRELLADEGAVHDLSVERMAVLCYTGLCGWLTAAHVQSLVVKQLPDGSWGELPVEVHRAASFPPGHTAALAFLVLATRWAEHQPRLPVPRAPGQR